MTASLAHPPRTEPILDGRLTELMPELDSETFSQLEQAILRDGCTEPLSVWAETGKLLDGRHRLRICQAHGLPWSVVEISLPDEESARAWVMERALARRNLSPWHVRLYRGKLYLRAKKAHGDAGRTKQAVPSGQLDHLGDSSLTTAAAVAAQHGVSEKTVRRDAEFAQAVDALPAEARGPVLAGQVPGIRAPADVVGLVKRAARPLTLAELQAQAAALAASRKPRPSSDPAAADKPFRQFSVKKVIPYTDVDDGQEYVDAIGLSCGCLVKAKRRMRLDAKRKAMPCPTHSGLRTGYERRLAARALKDALQRAWAPERREHLEAFVRGALLLLTLAPGDAREERVREEMAREARCAGLYDEIESGQRGRGAMLAQHSEEE